MKLVLDPHLHARENMDRDEKLLAAGDPVVRLYGWRPAAVSLGRAQTPAEVDEDALSAHGLDLVQRGTGGGAILHNEQEVTYAVVLPLDWPGLPKDIPGSFAYVSRGIVNALHALGVDAAIESAPDATRDALCYLRVQGTNVLVDGRKISGGAQRRTRTHLLQHGTVIVHRDAQRMAEVFRSDVDRIERKVTSLEDEGVRVSREKLLETLVAGFADAFDTDLRV